MPDSPPFQEHQIVHTREGLCYQIVRYAGKDRWLVRELDGKKRLLNAPARDLFAGVLMETIILGTTGQTTGIYERGTQRKAPNHE